MKNMIAIDNKYKEWLGEVGSKFKIARLKQQLRLMKKCYIFIIGLAEK